MWACDIFCDYDWLDSNNGKLGEPSVRLSAMSGIINSKVEILFFSDERGLRHVRFIIHTDDQKLAQQCVDANIMLWIDSIEAGVILHTQTTFSIPRINGSLGIAFGLCEYLGGGHFAVVLRMRKPAMSFDPRILAASLKLWSPETRHHLFYYRRLIDPGILLDQRWLYGYKLFEWHFVKKDLNPQKRAKSGGHDLPKNESWRMLLEGYRDKLGPYLNTSQPERNQLYGLIERVREMTAHAHVDERSIEDLRKQPQNLINLTFPILQEMAMDLMNSLIEKDAPARLTKL
ncbi:MAG: hypothetical protein WC802_05715 [Patescibacteria group bacterium]|jgi:hypothetical protein